MKCPECGAEMMEIEDPAGAVRKCPDCGYWRNVAEAGRDTDLVEISVEDSEDEADPFFQEPRVHRHTYRRVFGQEEGPFVFRYERVGGEGCFNGCTCGCLVIGIILALAVRGFMTLL